MSHVKSGGRFPGFALLFLCCVNPVCVGQMVTIRIVDVTSESPLRNERVYISGIRRKAAKEEDERLKLKTKPVSADLTLTTDPKGEVGFVLPNPAPAYFYVRTALSESHWDCTSPVRISTEEVVQKGVVTLSPYAARGKPEPQIQPKPGEVLFALRPLPLWVRFLFPLLKR